MKCDAAAKKLGEVGKNSGSSLFHPGHNSSGEIVSNFGHLTSGKMQPNSKANSEKSSKDDQKNGK